MAKTSKLSELIGAKGELISRADFLTEKSKEFTKKYKGAKHEDAPVAFDEATVKELLKMAETGEELADEGAPQYAEALAALVVIVNDTNAKNAEAEKAAAAKAKEEEKAKAEVAKAELALVESVKTVAYADAYKNFSAKFDVGEKMNQCIPKKGVEVTAEDLVGAMALGFGMESASQWIVADTAAALQDMGHENVVIQLAEQFKKGYPTVSGWVRTAKAIEPAKRDSNVSFTVYREIANAKFSDKPEKQADTVLKLVDKAAKENWTSQTAREEVKKKQGKVTEAPEPKADFLVIAKDGALSLSKEEPAWEDGVTVVNVKTRQVLGPVEVDDGKGGVKEVIDWADIETK